VQSEGLSDSAQKSSAIDVTCYLHKWMRHEARKSVVAAMFVNGKLTTSCLFSNEYTCIVNDANFNAIIRSQYVNYRK